MTASAAAETWRRRIAADVERDGLPVTLDRIDRTGDQRVAVADRRVRRDADTAVVSAHGRELALLHHWAGSLDHWWVDEDPHLPAMSDPIALATDATRWQWRPGAAPATVERVERMERLVYRPGQRAVFVLLDRDGPIGTMRLLRAGRASSVATHDDAITRCGVHDVLDTPRVLGTAREDDAIWCHYVPGAPLAPQSGRSDGLEAATTLATIHNRPTDPRLPVWDRSGEVERSARLVDQAAIRSDDRDVRRSIEAAARRVRLAEGCAGGGTTVLVHGDFTARNLVRTPGGRIGVLDWDGACRGPSERDLASLLAGAARRAGGVVGDPLIDAYVAAGGTPPDTSLVLALGAHQRLLKLCRRLLGGTGHPSDLVERFDRILP